MIRRVGKFKLPNKIKIVSKKEDLNKKQNKKKISSIFVAEPFEIGYGHTIGNTLRRILLSSIEGAAITSFKIKGVQHEFQGISGIVEDVTDIVLNLKKIKLIIHDRSDIKLFIDVKKEGIIRASDISKDSRIKIVNPDQKICCLSKFSEFYCELEAKVGRGFCISKRNLILEQNQEIGKILIDSLFSPILNVEYSVDNTRVGHMTEYDKLTLKISTDGRISPEDALLEAVSILKHHLDIFFLQKDKIIEFEKDEKISIKNEKDKKINNLMNMSVNEIELSVRAANCLNNANITTLGELSSKTEQEMLKYRNFGKKSLNEIKKKLKELNLSLGKKNKDKLKN
jgi:DNA-directed RNA polymerase subunit alpha